MFSALNSSASVSSDQACLEVSAQAGETAGQRVKLVVTHCIFMRATDNFIQLPRCLSPAFHLLPANFYLLDLEIL